MANFNYTARDKSGALTRGNLAAADRAAALEALKAKGLVPVSVEVGAAAQRPSGVLPPRKITLTMLAGAAIILAGVVFTYRTATRKAEPKPSSPPAAIKEKPPAKAVPAKSAVVPAAEPRPPDDPMADAAPAEVERPKPSPVPVRPVVRRVPDPAEVRPLRGVQRRLAEAIEKGLPTEPIFRHEAESILAFYIRPGDPVPPHPLPDNIEEAARKALAEDIVVYSDDTPEQIQEKELVAWMKEDLRQHLAKGGTAKAFFELVQARQTEESALLLEARSVLGELSRSGDDAKTMEAYKAINEELATKGIAPLPLPGRLRKVAR